MKKQILELRRQGKTYNEIVKITGASKGTISFHCSPIAKKNYNKRTREYRRKFKTSIKEKHGGKCQKCGYDKCLDSLEFHHKNPNSKKDTVSNLMCNESFKSAEKEAKKCILVCVNCHREIHNSKIKKPRLTNNSRTKFLIKLKIKHGAKCKICGYDTCLKALEFHHKSPSNKSESITNLSSHGFKNTEKEADKCDLICGNCHRETHTNQRQQEKLLTIN